MKPHIVLIEDDHDLRSMLTELLTSYGNRVTALQQVDSIEDLLQLKANLFIIDEQLPMIRGHILGMVLKSKTETKHIPIILMSADDTAEHKASLCEANAYLKKPFNDIDEIKRLIFTTLAN